MSHEGACSAAVAGATRWSGIRGNRADYDEWAAMGLSGYGYQDVLPYFERGERTTGASQSYYHGISRPLAVQRSDRSLHPLVGACIDTAVEAGMARHDDHNSTGQEGAGWLPGHATRRKAL